MLQNGEIALVIMDNAIFLLVIAHNKENQAVQGQMK
jgi:hypothetical protein